MKKRLTLTTQTILPLSGDRLREVVGGSLIYTVVTQNPPPVGPHPISGTSTPPYLTTYYYG